MGGQKRSDAFWRKLHEKIEAGYSAGRVKAEMLAQAGVRANVYWYNCQRLGLKRLALKGLPRKNGNGNGNGQFVEFGPPDADAELVECDVAVGGKIFTLRAKSPKLLLACVEAIQAREGVAQ